MKLLRYVLGLTLLVGLAAPVAAQNFKFGSGNTGVVAWGAYVGPYTGVLTSVPGQPTVDIFCVDYLHEVSNGDVWTATFTSLSGNVADADFLADTYGRRFRGWDGAIALQRYQAAAFLATQFSTQPTSQWGNIHGAIWNLMSDGTATQWNNSSITVGGNAGSQTLMSGALAAVAADPSVIDPSQWTVISDVEGGKQEFMMQQSVVPEPETVILLVTGLLAMGAVAYFRGFSA